jgi:hypothetical protein
VAEILAKMLKRDWGKIKLAKFDQKGPKNILLEFLTHFPRQIHTLTSFRINPILVCICNSFFVKLAEHFSKLADLFYFPAGNNA